MTCGPVGWISSFPLKRVGIQYAERSPGATQAVPPAPSEAVVLLAFVVLFPMNVWSWDAPARPG
ncbi:hypothetical protein SMICM304S_04989 [Streptomyces microflavus]